MPSRENRVHAALGLSISVKATGRGLILIAGPSSCGKGAISKALLTALQIPSSNYVSMGDALRGVIQLAADPAFRVSMGDRFGIWSDRAVLTDPRVAEATRRKAVSYVEDLRERFGESPSEVDWLEYCVTTGLIAPDAWSERVVEETIGSAASGENGVVLLDGYPRTEAAAGHVLQLAERFSLPIIKVIHLSVSKREMHRRALGRRRADDTPEGLERRYQFYVEQVQPAVELLKSELGSHAVALVDAHQPAYREDGELDLAESVDNVSRNVLISMGLSRHILNHCTMR